MVIRRCEWAGATSILLAWVLASCTPTPQSTAKIATPTAQPSPPYGGTPPPDLRETATPGQTLSELAKQPVTALDLGLYRLHQEIVPELDQRLRAANLLPPANPKTVDMRRGYILISAIAYPGAESMEISVNTGFGTGEASERGIRDLQDLQSKIVSYVRAYLGGPCAASDSDVQNGGFCQSASNFYWWFKRPSEGSNDSVAETRAAYNLYSLISIKVLGSLVGKHHAVFVSCTGPAIRVEVKCTATDDK